MCDATGFRFELIDEPGAVARVRMGDEVPLSKGATLEARFPASCRIRLLSPGR